MTRRARGDAPARSHGPRAGRDRRSAETADLALTHVDESGRARMVDVGDKRVTRREATATGRVRLSREALRAVLEDRLRAGDVATVARLAGIQAAKDAARLIPLAHPLSLDHIDVRVRTDDEPPSVHVAATARTSARTGVEMEALTAVAVALLAVYDMVKAIDRGAVIEHVRLEEKTGGKSGPWRRGTPSGGRA